jgi:effector-binding domain-containing protein
MNLRRAPEPEIVDVSTATAAVIRDVVATADFAAFFDRSFPTIAAVLSTQGIAIIGPAFALYHGHPTPTADVEAGFVTERAVQPDGDVHVGALPAGRVARLVHHGSYDQLGSTWDQLRTWIERRGLTPGNEFWEVYTTEPSPEMDPADLRTELNWLVTD